MSMLSKARGKMSAAELFRWKGLPTRWIIVFVGECLLAFPRITFTVRSAWNRATRSYVREETYLVDTFEGHLRSVGAPQHDREDAIQIGVVLPLKRQLVVRIRFELGEALLRLASPALELSNWQAARF